MKGWKDGQTLFHRTLLATNGGSDKGGMLQTRLKQDKMYAQNMLVISLNDSAIGCYMQRLHIFLSKIEKTQKTSYK